ncbi:hypothetical protein GQ600_9504 [Phytophthora cactorum]|nr:hypothetical protein GQ600_9504 [Phytophthora cactorum]
MEWETISRRSGGVLRLKTRSASFWGMTPIQPALNRASSDSTLQQQQQRSSKRLSKPSERDAEYSPGQTAGIGERNNFGVDAAPFLKKPDLAAGEDLGGRRQVTLLSRKMSKKFKACWPSSLLWKLALGPHTCFGANAQ